MRRTALQILIALSAGLLQVAASGPAGASPDLTNVKVKLVTVVSGLDQPVALAWRSGDPRMYVAEQSGRVRVVYNGKVVATALTLSVSTGGEQGLLGLTFSRDGTKMYVDYTDPNGDTRVAEYTMSGVKADVSTRRQLLFEDQPYANHNGGQVTIGPDDMLYIALGDGGGSGDPNNLAQNLGSRLGKILRVDPHPSSGGPVTIPPDNPFVGVSGARPAIWMYGLRNPWRWSFDRGTGDVWIGDVGQDKYEEVDYVKKADRGLGINWGWSLREGFHAFKGAKPPGARDPILERAHTSGDCAVTGGYVYRGSQIPKLVGGYVFGDYCTGVIRAVEQQNGAIVQSKALGVNVPYLTTFGQAAGG